MIINCSMCTMICNTLSITQSPLSVKRILIQSQIKVKNYNYLLLPETIGYMCGFLCVMQSPVDSVESESL